MSWSFGGGGSGSGGILNVPSDQIFNSEAERDTYFANNPTKLTEGAQCIIVTNAPAGLYQVYTSGAWEDRSQVVRGPQGDKGDKGDDGSISTVGLTADTLPVVNNAGDNLADSPLSVDAQGNVSMSGAFTATELKTNIASLNLGDQKKISGLGEGVEIHNLTLDKHKLIITQELDKDEDTRAFQYKQEEYQLINIQPVFNTTLTDPEFTFTTQLGDQILYGFEVKVNTTQNNCVAQIFRNTEFLSLGNDAHPIWEETFNNVQSDTLVLSSPVVLDGNTTYMFKITGEFLGEPGGRMYYSIGARLAEKQELLDGSDRVNVDAIQTPNIETGNGLQSVESGGSVIIEVSGNKDVIEFDVSLDATRTINNSYVGKFVSLTQTGAPVAIPMQITIDQHSAFNTGDEIKIGASAEYVNYYFAVYYTDVNNVQKVVYPAKSVTMIRTDRGWDVEKDGTYTNVAIIPQVGTVDASEDNPLLVPVNSFAFIDHPAVNHFDNQDGTRAVSIDLNLVDAGNFSVDGNDTSDLIIGSGINYSYDAATKESTISIDPTNISLDDYAQIETDVTFSKLSIANDTDPNYVSVFNVTNDGNSELNLVGTTNIRKITRDTGSVSDVMRIYGSTGDVDFLTTPKKSGVELASLDEVAAASAFKGAGLAADSEVLVSATTQTQTEPVTRFVHNWANSSSVTITVDDSLLVGSETIVYLPDDAGPGSVTYTVIFGANSLAKSVRRGETWVCKANSFGLDWSRVDKGLVVVSSLRDRGVEIVEPAIKLFQYSEGMPYHLLIETPGTINETARARLIHEFPKEKTFVFSPNATGRTYVADVVVNETNQGVAAGDLELGEYSDFPLYVMEPNVVINRDQRASISFPADMTIDVSNGFYFFGTISGWCGNNRTSGTANVYVGTQDNTRSPFGSVGFRVADDGLYMLDGTTNATPSAGAHQHIKFQKDDGLANFYRFAVYVDNTGLMRYYIVSLNDGQVAEGSIQCTLANIGSNPKLYMTYDRLSNNTAAIAIGETHFVLNTNNSPAEGRWNWRN